jgi:hypothetical protein
MFAVLAWTLWNIRNKLTIEGKCISNPADTFFQMCLHLQRWKVRVRLKDRPLLDEALDEVRRLHASLRAEDGVHVS